MNKKLMALLAVVVLVLSVGFIVNQAQAAAPLTVTHAAKSCGDRNSAVRVKITNNTGVARAYNARAYYGEPETTVLATGNVTLAPYTSKFLNAEWDDLFTLQFKVWTGTIAQRSAATNIYNRIYTC